jgi:Bacterial Ig domain
MGNRPGCPNVGWAFPFDTTQLDDGYHTLAVSAFTTDAVPRRSTSIISFSTANANGPEMYVNVPGWAGTQSGTFTISGWAMDAWSTVGAVTIAIDGNSYGSASYGGNMQGVCDIMGNYPGCPNVGLSFPINTAELTNGGHTLTVTTFSSELVPRSVSQSVLFYASNADPSAQNQPTVMIDVPAAQATYSGTQNVFRLGAGRRQCDQQRGCCDRRHLVRECVVRSRPLGCMRVSESCRLSQCRLGLQHRHRGITGWSAQLDDDGSYQRCDAA